MAISKINFNSIELATRQGKNLMSLPLKDGRAAKVLFNDNAIDCYILNKGKLDECDCKSGSTEYIIEETAFLLDKLESLVAKGVDIWREYTKAVIRNIK